MGGRMPTVLLILELKMYDTVITHSFIIQYGYSEEATAAIRRSIEFLLQ